MCVLRGLGGGIPQQAKVHCAQAKRTEKAGWVPIYLLASKAGNGIEGNQYAVLFE